MADQLDHAKDVELMHRADALARQQANQKKEKPLFVDGLKCCLDCGDVMSNERIEAQPNAVRCVGCQTLKDKKDRGFYHY